MSYGSQGATTHFYGDLLIILPFTYTCFTMVKSMITNAIVSAIMIVNNVAVPDHVEKYFRYEYAYRC